MVNSISPFQADKLRSARTHANPTLMPATISSNGKSGSTSNIADSVSVSSLSKQLSSATASAEIRSKTISRPELAARAKDIILKLHGEPYIAHKAAHDRESMSITDPEHRARAEQATLYVNSAKLNHETKNPFYGFSREQLATITYDESGTFTVNERVAAHDEAFRQDSVWREKVADMAMAEYAETGKLTNFFQEVLRYFNELPEMEQMHAPAGYAADLESKIKADFNYNPKHAEKQQGTVKDLLSIMLERQLETSFSPFNRAAAQKL